MKSLHAYEDQTGTDGKKLSIDNITDVSPERGQLLHGICRVIKPLNTLGIGFAYGVSTHYILAALRENGQGIHTTVDPFEVEL